MTCSYIISCDIPEWSYGGWVDGWLGLSGWIDVLQVAGNVSAAVERARERPIWRTGSPWGRCALRCSGVDNTRLASLPDFNWQFWRRARLYIHGPTRALHDNRYGIGNPLCTATTRRRWVDYYTTTAMTIGGRAGGESPSCQQKLSFRERGSVKPFVYIILDDSPNA